MIQRAMVLAAGRGERMRPLTDHCPKPLLKAGGKALIEYHLEALAAAGVREVVINLAWQGEQLRSVLGGGGRYGLTITYSDEGPSALETAGGIFRALPYLGDGPFLVVNGDIWTDWRLVEGAEGKLGDNWAHLYLVANPPHHPHGDFGLAGNRVVETGEPRYTYSGIGIYTPRFFTECRPGAFPLLPLLLRAIRAGKLGGEVYGGEWYDIGTPERLAELDARLQARQVSPFAPLLDQF